MKQKKQKSDYHIDWLYRLAKQEVECVILKDGDAIAILTIREMFFKKSKLRKAFDAMDVLQMNAVASALLQNPTREFDLLYQDAVDHLAVKIGL